MRRTLGLIDKAYEITPNCCVAFSGGTDSLVLFDIMYRHTQYRPAVVYCDDQMSYPETEQFVREVSGHYGAELIVTSGKLTPLEMWRRHGYAMLGKMAARVWAQNHKGLDFGYKLDVSTCCRKMKIEPARKELTRRGYELQFTGQRGNVDDRLRGMRSHMDGAIKYVKTDKIYICNALEGWTDTMISRYVRQNKLKLHPARERGAITIGCLYCGGGAQFTNSGFRVLREQRPEEWRKFIVDWKVGEIILSVKYDRPLHVIRRAIECLGGLKVLADVRPWIFDYLRENPLLGYEK